MVPDCTGGQLHAVADEVILVSGDGERIDFAALGFQKHLEATGRHGERVVAELELTGLVADLIHREVDDPAELIALLVHMAGHVRAEDLDHHANKLCSRFARRDEHQRVGLQA